MNALRENQTGGHNTALGAYALYNNTVSDNTAFGHSALYSNTTGYSNVAVGNQALITNTTGAFNVANGYAALYSNTTGINNVAIGYLAGNQTSGSDNVYIGYDVFGAAGENDSTYISNVYSSVASARAVYVNSNNKIGTLSSSRRYKEEIEPMTGASERLFDLKPVTFRYKKEIDPGQALSFGLIAEEVAQVSPDLITRDEEAKPQTVRYEAVNAMLLNEFLKEHRKVETQEARITQLEAAIERQAATTAQQHEQIQALTAGLQKVNAQIEANRPAPQTVVSNH